LSALQWACIDTGRWDEALAASRQAADLAAAYTMKAVAASADLATATVLATLSTRPSTAGSPPGPGMPRASRRWPKAAT
jgi:hypothetical protein